MATPIIPLLEVIPSSLKQRYLASVIKQDGCWSWTGKLRKGYAVISHAAGRGRDLSAHRVSYAIHYGVDPLDLMVCHKCDNPICTNPVHLFLGTAKDNSDDKIAKGRARHPDSRGEKNPRSILTREDVRYIRLASNIRMANTELAVLFGVHHATISAIKLGKIWPDIYL